MSIIYLSIFTLEYTIGLQNFFYVVSARDYELRFLDVTVVILSLPHFLLQHTAIYLWAFLTWIFPLKLPVQMLLLLFFSTWNVTQPLNHMAFDQTIYRSNNFRNSLFHLLRYVCVNYISPYIYFFKLYFRMSSSSYSIMHVVARDYCINT